MAGLLCSSVALGQANAPAVPPPEVDFARLGLTSGEIVRLQLDRTVGRELEVVVPIGGEHHRIKLAPHSVRAPEFRLYEAREGGVLFEVDPGPVNTLRGALTKSPGSIVAGGMMPDGLWAMIQMGDGERYWLEPLGARGPGAGDDQYVLYRSSDVRQDGFQCDVDEARHRIGELHTGGYEPRGLNRFTAQVAVECDFEYFNLYGSSSLVNSRIALVYNVLNVQYEREVEIVHTISSTIVNTVEPDPYTQGTTGGMLGEMRTFWNANRSGVARDVAHLFTGKPTGGVIGTAYLGVICSSLSSGFGYGVSQTDFNNFNLSSAADLVAHETGHNWNACHCPCGSYPNQFTMNPSITSINRFGSTVTDECSTNSTAAIEAHRNSRSCLTSAADAPPLNDACASAVPIGPGTWGFSNLEATNDGPASCGGIGADLWYSYTAPHDGTIIVSTCGTHDNYALDTVLAAYTGVCGTLTEIVCNDDNTGQCGSLDTGTLRDSYISFSMTRNTRYLIRVGGFGSTSGQGLLRVSVSPCLTPLNDLCANAETITDGSYPYTTICSSTDGFVDDAAGCTAFGYQQTGSDIWFRYVGCGSSVTASICGADRNYDTRIAVYNSCPNGPYQAIACNDDSCGTGSSITWTATNGVAYLIRVGGYSGAQGSGTLVVARQQQSNENCSTAAAITAPGGASGSTLCSTNDGSATCAASANSPDVWYAHTADHTGFFYANTETSGTVTSNYDTALSVHSGCPGTTANQIACDDDSGTGLLSRAVWYQVAGTTYYIRVNGFNNSRGIYSLNVGPVPNDNCLNAVTIGVGTYLDSLAFATNEPANSVGTCGVSSSNPDAWYRFVAPCAGTLTATTCGTHDATGIDLGMDTVLSLHSGCGGTVYSCNDDSLGTCGPLDTSIFRDSAVSRVLAAGEAVLIRVSKFSAATAGAYRLNVQFAGTNCHGPGRLLGIESGRALYEINPNTGEMTQIAAVSAVAGTTGGLAVNCANRTIYVTSTSNDSVYTLNDSTGAVTLVGPYGDSAVVMHGIEFDESTGTLYGMSSHNNGFYSINRSTGAATLIGTAGFVGAFPNIVYNNLSDVMYATNGGDDSLYRLDRSTGAATLVGPLLGPTNPNGLAFNRDNGLLYLVDNTTDSLYLVNQTTGAATRIGALGAVATNMLGLVYISNQCIASCHGACIADFDDGSGTGSPDGGVTIDDLLYYLVIFEQGAICADVDDGSGTGTTDGGVTIDDLLYFLLRFESGC